MTTRPRGFESLRARPVSAPGHRDGEADQRVAGRAGRDLVAFANARDAADVAAGVAGALRGRTTSTEVGLAVGVAPLTAASRVATAEVAVKDHPRLLNLPARIGSGLDGWVAVGDASTRCGKARRT
ncbi:MAG: hypothetical protein H0V23_03670 [Nocardioidaceae bacterium]|nr:hypothetical protein [Nocardioidaceae bacterium]